jgi:hypothetical protein
MTHWKAAVAPLATCATAPEAARTIPGDDTPRRNLVKADDRMALVWIFWTGTLVFLREAILAWLGTDRVTVPMQDGCITVPASTQDCDAA